MTYQNELLILTYLLLRLSKNGCILKIGQAVSVN